MDKTKVDDMLIEMITPKVKEIEEKFGRKQKGVRSLLLHIELRCYIIE